MHSRIYQISKAPIPKHDYIEESDYYEHWFTNEIADYVNGNTNRYDDIRWLKECYENKGLSFGVDNNGEYLVVESKTQYFASNFEAFKNALKELSEKTIDGFANGECETAIYHLKEAYDDKFGFYVDGEEYNCETFDCFVRYSDVGTKYYIGATIDYHF